MPERQCWLFTITMEHRDRYLHRPGQGDYTRGREKWQKELTLERIPESIREHRPR